MHDWKHLKNNIFSHILTQKLWPRGVIFALSGCFDVMSDNFKGILGSRNKKRSDFFFVCRSGKFSTWCVTPQKKNFHTVSTSAWLWNLEFAPKKLESKNSWAISACRMPQRRSIRHFRAISRISGPYLRTFDALFCVFYNQAEIKQTPNHPIKIRRIMAHTTRTHTHHTHIHTQFINF